MRRCAAHVSLAASVGLLAGFVFGAREAALTLLADAAAQEEQYFFLFAATPVLTWLVLGVLLLLPFGLVVAVVRRDTEPRQWLPMYGAVSGAAGAASVMIPLTHAAAARLAEVGVRLALARQAVLWCVAAVVIVAAAAMAAAAGTWSGRRTAQLLRYSAAVVIVVGLVLLWPVAQFFAADWKWRETTAAADAIGDSGLRLPNVLLISIDTLRADALGSYGNPHGLTPHIDALARDGVLFEQAITSAPWTLPAMASLFTGLYPRHHGAGIISNHRDPLGRSALPEGSWTLASALRARGHQTHAIVTNPYLSLRYGLGQGFDIYANVTIESEAFLSMADTTAFRLLKRLYPTLISGDRGAVVSDRAVKWLAQRRASKPFFLWLHYIDPHPPYSRAGVTANKSFRGDLSFARPGDGAADITLTSPDVARLRSGEIRLSAAEKEGVRNLYRAEVQSVDAAVGRILGAIEAQGLSADTLIVCVADHGEEFWEHGGVEHGRTVYDEVVRVPLLMRWPGHLPAGRRVAAVARITDVAPTILDLIGIAAPSRVDGESLLPLLGSQPAPRVALTENMLFAEERIGIRTSDRNYVRWEDGKEEVYDLVADPQERIDLAGDTGVVEPLRRLYADLGVSTAPEVAEAKQPRIEGGTAEAMRALGYLQ